MPPTREIRLGATECALELLGADRLLKPDGYPMERPAWARLWVNPQQAFLRPAGRAGH
jgi:hypothetical protein